MLNILLVALMIVMVVDIIISGVYIKALRDRNNLKMDYIHDMTSLVLKSLRRTQEALEDLQYEHLLGLARQNGVISESVYLQHVQNSIDMRCAQVRFRNTQDEIRKGLELK